MERQPQILIVDDQEPNRRLLAALIENLGYEYALAENGFSALARLESSPFDLVLLDLMMPDMNGFEVLDHMRGSGTLAGIPVIVISGVDDMREIAKCIEHGAEDFLVKPFNSVLLRARMNACLEKKRLYDREQGFKKQIQDYNLRLEDRVRAQVRQISSAQMATIFALSKLAESRDSDTGEHLERMREYCRIMAEELSKLADYATVIKDDFIDDLCAASPLHDIGKVGIPDDILLKPGRFSEEELAIMKTHTLIGAQTLRNVDEIYPGNDFLRMGIEIAESHHERWDGGGYPNGRGGIDIPLSARVLTICDVYDALTSKRCYKEAMSHKETLELIEAEGSKHFDPVMTQVFFKVEAQFADIRSRFHDNGNGSKAKLQGVRLRDPGPVPTVRPSA